MILENKNPSDIYREILEILKPNEKEDILIPKIKKYCDKFEELRYLKKERLEKFISLALYAYFHVYKFSPTDIGFPTSQTITQLPFLKGKTAISVFEDWYGLDNHIEPENYITESIHQCCSSKILWNLQIGSVFEEYYDTTNGMFGMYETGLEELKKIIQSNDKIRFLLLSYISHVDKYIITELIKTDVIPLSKLHNIVNYDLSPNENINMFQQILGNKFNKNELSKVIDDSFSGYLQAKKDSLHPAIKWLPEYFETFENIYNGAIYVKEKKLLFQNYSDQFTSAKTQSFAVTALCNFYKSDKHFNSLLPQNFKIADLHHEHEFIDTFLNNYRKWKNKKKGKYIPDKKGKVYSR